MADANVVVGVPPNFFDLPWEDVIFSHIFPRLSILELFRCRGVCRFFREVCDSFFARQRTLNCDEVASRLTPDAFALITRTNSCMQELILNGCKGWLCEVVLVDVLKRNARLSGLDLTACSSLTNWTLFSLAKFNPDLKELTLRECRWVSSNAVIQLSLCCNGLRYVDLTGCWEVSDACVASVASCCSDVHTVLLNDCYSVSDDSVRIIARSCPKLCHLGLRGCWRVSNSAVALVGEYCRNLAVLEIKDCRDITEASLARLRVRGVKIDVEKPTLLGPERLARREWDDWRIPTIHLNI